MAEPVQISLDELSLSSQQKRTDDDGFRLDVGCLCIEDPKPIQARHFKSDVEKRIVELSVDAVRALLAKISQLPRSHSNEVVALPPPSTSFPRHKPVPTPKPLTRWEKFAKEKGIKKRKKERKVWDESKQEWRRRFGYKRVNDEKDVAIVEAKPTDKFGENPFEKMKTAKKERVERQKKRELRNVQRAVKQGERLPTSVQLVADLPKAGKGHPLGRKKLKDGIETASKIAGLSTASMGKFDKALEGEAADERISVRKKRTLVNVNEQGEKKFLQKMSERLVKRQAENVLDVEKAVGKIEAEKRRKRHQEKIEEEQATPKRQRSQKKMKKRQLEPLPKLKTTSAQKRVQKRKKKSR